VPRHIPRHRYGVQAVTAEGSAMIMVIAMQMMISMKMMISIIDINDNDDR